MNATSEYLEWVILFEKEPSGWVFKATYPGYPDSLSDGIFYPLFDIAIAEAKALIHAHRNTAKFSDFLTHLKQNQDISSKGYTEGLALISELVPVSSQFEL
jgi:hypothetical protein